MKVNMIRSFTTKHLTDFGGREYNADEPLICEVNIVGRHDKFTFVLDDVAATRILELVAEEAAKASEGITEALRNAK